MRKFFGLVLAVAMVMVSFSALADVEPMEFPEPHERELKVSICCDLMETYMYVCDAYTYEVIRGVNTGAGVACRETGLTINEAVKVAEALIGGYAEIGTDDEGATTLLYFSIKGGMAKVELVLNDKGSVPLLELATSLTQALESNPEID